MSQADPLRTCSGHCLLNKRIEQDKKEFLPKFCPVCGEKLRPLEGSTLEEFKILKVLGAGGFGVVYRAETTEGKVDAAIKVLKPPDCYHEDKVDALLGEVELMAADLKAGECEQIVGVKTVRREPFPHIVMDYANDGSLQGLLMEHRASAGEEGTGSWIDLRLTRKLIFDIALALEHAHNREVVHRDLKPGNLLLHKKKGTAGKDGAVDQLQCKVVDWGTSSSGATFRVSEEALGGEHEPATSTRKVRREDDETELDELVGRFDAFTPKYGPPEHYTYGKKIDRKEHSVRELRQELKDARVDVYQFGLLAYETLTGEFPFPPYTKKHHQQRIDAYDYWEQQYGKYNMTPLRDLVKRREIRNRTGIRHVFPFSKSYSETAKYIDVIDRCLSRDRDERYANGAEIVKALRKKPVLLDLRSYAAAACLVIVALVGALFLLPREPAPSVKTFWQNFESDSGAPVTFEPSKISLESGGEQYCPIFWIDRVESLAESTFSYAPPSDDEKFVSEVRIERWASPVGAGPARRIPADPGVTLSRETTARIAPVTAGKLEIRFDELAKSMAEETSWKADQSGQIFSFTIALGKDGSEGEKLVFFEIRKDARVPEIALERLEIVSGDQRAGYPELIEALGGAADREERIFVPPPKPGEEASWDLVFTFSLTGEGAANELLFPSGEPLRNRSDQKKAGVFAKVNSSPELPLIRKASGEFELRVSKELGEDPLAPTLRGESASVVLIARTKSQAASDRQVEKTVELVLDSGPWLYVSPREQWKKESGGVARIPLEVESGLSEANCELIWSLGAPPTGAGKSPPARWVSRGKDAADVFITLPESFLGGSPADTSELFLSARETKNRLFYPTLNEPDLGLTAVDIQKRNRQVVPDAEPTIDDLTVKASTFPQRRNDGEFKRGSDGFYWRFMSLQNLPGSITADFSSFEDNQGIKIEWRCPDLEDDWSRGGPTLATEPLGTQFAAGVKKLTLQATVETVWTKKATFGVVLEFDPRGSGEEARDGEGFLSFFDEVLLKDCGEEQSVFSSGQSVAHVKRCDQLTLSLLSSDQYLGTVELTVNGEPVSVAEGDADGKLAALVYSEGGSELLEEEYRLTFSLTDDFRNTRSFTRFLYVHGDPPKILSVEGLLPGDEEQTINAKDGKCSLLFIVSDGSGIETVLIERDGKQRTVDFFKHLSEKKLTDEKRRELEEISVDVQPQKFDLKGPGLEQPAEVRLRFLNVKESGEDIEITAWDRKQLGNQPRNPGNFGCPVRCLREDQSAIWLGLNWIYIRGRIRDEDFYITQTEIPQWFYERYSSAQASDSSGSPPDPGSPDWTPMTKISPREMQSFASDRIQDVYLPTAEEWKKIPAFDWVQAGVIGEVRNDSKEWRDLQASVNCRRRRDGEVIVPVLLKSNDLGNLDKSLVERLFNGVHHLLGNVEEVVEDKRSKTGFSAYGGHHDITLTDCVENPLTAQGTDKNTNRGFRLVLYSRDSSIEVPGRDRRVVNRRFLGEKQPLPEADEN